MNRVPLLARAWRQLPLLGLCLLVSCARQPERQPPTPTEENLSTIGRAYMEAMTKLRRPPRNVADLLPFLNQMGGSRDTLRSPNDGEEFVILWNVKGEEMAVKGAIKDGVDERKFPVLAYEKTGTDGSRYVLMVPNRIRRMTDDDLHQAYFPGGHKPKF
jgi:hypothetical protein